MYVYITMYIEKKKKERKKETTENKGKLNNSRGRKNKEWESQQIV